MVIRYSYVKIALLNIKINNVIYLDPNKDLDDIPPLYKLPLTAGSAVIFTENISHAMKSPKEQTHHWLKFQYGPSYFVNFPKCTPSQSLLKRTANDPVKSHLLLPPYYHPEGSQ